MRIRRSGKNVAPEEAADVEIMLREQAKIVSGPAESVMDAAFAAKRAALTSGSSGTEFIAAQQPEAVKEQ